VRAFSALRQLMRIARKFKSLHSWTTIDIVASALPTRRFTKSGRPAHRRQLNSLRINFSGFEPCRKRHKRSKISNAAVLGNECDVLSWAAHPVRKASSCRSSTSTNFKSGMRKSRACAAQTACRPFESQVRRLGHQECGSRAMPPLPED
jgi:hypothetical protein